MKIAFIQPFSLTCASGGGGGRILRGALRAAPANVQLMSCNTSLYAGQSLEAFSETWLPYRPHFGRIERTRLSWLPDLFDEVWWRIWRGKLMNFLLREKVTHLHVVPHSGLDFVAAAWCAKKLCLPLAMSVHDHPRYCFKESAFYSRRLLLFEKIWKSAGTHFVISRELGVDLSLTYGNVPFQIITDGVKVLPFVEKVRNPSEMNIYFMGLFHRSYRSNFNDLLRSLEVFGESFPSVRCFLTLRCGGGVNLNPPANVVLRELPFGSEEVVSKEMTSADVLYLPLPFDAGSKNFVEYSLSTKMISYLSSGRPILYHGPETTPVCALLREHSAALISSMEDPCMISDKLSRLHLEQGLSQELGKSAQKLALERFNPDELHSKFWHAIVAAQS